jgi:hypothetical protein
VYDSSNIIRVIKSRRMVGAGHVARMGETRDVNNIFLGYPEGKRTLGKDR